MNPYLRLKPRWGLKPSCSHVPAWIGDEQTILTGPWALVPTIRRKLAAEARKVDDAIVAVDRLAQVFGPPSPGHPAMR